MITGTLLNAGTVLLGGLLGTLLGGALTHRFHEIVMQALGLATLLIGIGMAIKTTNPLFPLLGLLLGGLIGEACRIEDGLENLGAVIERRFSGIKGEVSEAFITSSLVFCVGPLTILGAIENGLTGDLHLLSIKSMLDGFAAFGFAASLGPGVPLSVITILLYQGGLSLTAGAMNVLLFTRLGHGQFSLAMNEMTAVGGLMVLAVGLRLLKLATLRVGSFLPGLIVAPILALASHALHLL